uniref:Uncharacterized protein n=1 Tax=Cucumis melo TaxID=3656 RepID=A0A9I9EK01_CUCME
MRMPLDPSIERGQILFKNPTYSASFFFFFRFRLIHHPSIGKTSLFFICFL